MTHHPMLTRNQDEDDAYSEGVYASMMLKDAHGIDRLRQLLTLRRAAQHDPGAAYNLAHILMERDPPASRRRIAALLLGKSVAMVKERLAAPSVDQAWDQRENIIRRLGSMALVNLGMIRQYALGLPDVAHDDYQDAARLYDANEVAHLNLGQMNFAALVSRPDGELAYRHYLKAIAYGVRCKSMKPGCECLVDITQALSAVPEGERTDALPRIRNALAKGEAAIAMPPTAGLTPEMATNVENAIDIAFEDLDVNSAIEIRVTRVASMAATITGLIVEHRTGDGAAREAVEIAETIVEALGAAARPTERQIMPAKPEDESADAERCMTMYDEEPVKAAYLAIMRAMREILDLTDDQDEYSAIMTHALKTVFGSASQAWRGGLLSTMPNGYRVAVIGNIIRIAVPGEIGRLNVIDTMRGWAKNPSTMR